MTNFTDSVQGFESAVASAQSWRGDKGNRPSPNIRIVKDKLRFKNRMCAKDATFLKRHAPGPFKITLPSPSNFAMLCWQAGVSAQAYPSRSEFIADMAGLIADEARTLADRGAFRLSRGMPLKPKARPLVVGRPAAWPSLGTHIVVLLLIFSFMLIAAVIWAAMSASEETTQRERRAERDLPCGGGRHRLHLRRHCDRVLANPGGAAVNSRAQAPAPSRP